MRQSCGGAYDNRRIELFRQIKRVFGVFERFLTVARLQYRHMCKTGKNPCVLLILRAVNARIITHHQNQRAIYANIGKRHQRIRRDIQTYMLHHGKGPHTGKGSPDGNI